jgi:protease IV
MRVPQGVARALSIVARVTASALLLLILFLVVGLIAGWVWGAAVVAALALLTLGLVILRWSLRRVPKRTILELDLERGLLEQLPDEPLARWTAGAAWSVPELVSAIRRAAKDPRVSGLIARIGPARIGLAHAQEIFDAVQAFRESGKRAIAWSETLGDGQSCTVQYLLACAFDEIHVQPGGSVGLNGLAIDQPFVRGLLDRVGVAPRMDHRAEYKTAKYLFTEDHLTAPHREMLTAVLESQAAQIASVVAQRRGHTAADVRNMMDEGPFMTQEAAARRLIDGISFRDEVYEKIEKELSGSLLYLEHYLARTRRARASRDHIALIYGVGPITRGRSRGRRLLRSGAAGADDIGAAFRAASRSKRVRAIVFRVNSPGGSAVASESIWREVKRARESGKPVVVSMSNLAASGGYYVAAPASRIVAEPGTITGSIGVVFGKLVTRDAWRKAGVTWQGVTVGANADIWSSTRDFTDVQWQRLQTFLDDIYVRFKQRVAEGRGMTLEQVEEVAKGRLWTGAEAVTRGLVDELGGFQRAVELAGELAGIPRERELSVAVYPRRRFTLAAARPRSSEAGNFVAAALDDVSELLEPVVPLLSAANAKEDVLRCPWLDAN